MPNENRANTSPAHDSLKRGYLRLGFELDSEGRSIMRHWERRAPLIVQQELYFDRAWEELPCVYILSSGGPSLEGDHYRHHITVGDDAYAHISTGAATKLAPTPSGYSSLEQTIQLEAGAYLEYLPEPTIPCRNTRYVATNEIVIDPSATLFFAETYLCGRRYYGERFSYDSLSLLTRARRSDGEELFCEKMVIEPKQSPVTVVGQMADYEIFATALILTPHASAEAIYQKIPSRIDSANRTVVAVTRLPSDCGVMCRVLGCESGKVKTILREICSTVREQIKQRPLPKEFAWR